MSCGWWKDGIIRVLVTMWSAILLWHFCQYCAPTVVCAAFWRSRRVRVILCGAVQCIVIIIISISSSNWITASRYSSIVEPANILKEIVGERQQSLNPARRGLNTDVRPASAFYWRRMPIHTSPGGRRRQNGSWTGPASRPTRDRERPVSKDGRTEARGSLSTYNNERRWQKLGSDDGAGNE